ncbi:hypothetical protein C0J52_08707 [Blattella germanica]|nr:hypothetical protein C0J52_08707 [Blattella germanica]
MKKQQEKTQYGNVASLKFYHDWVNDASVKQLDNLYTDFLSCLSGSGDSVFQILRPLEAVELNISHSEADLESLRNLNSDSDQSILSEDGSEEHINIKSDEILSSASSEKGLLVIDTTNERSIKMVRSLKLKIIN